MEKQYEQYFNSIRAADFKQIGVKEITKILVTTGSNAAFFYPKYHFGEFRCC